MGGTKEKNEVVIKLRRRIDADNAEDVDENIREIMEENPDATPVLDASELEYISSLGLRVLMRLRKSAGSPIRIDDVSPEIYEIFDVTGFLELFDVRKRLRQISIDGCEVIGKGFYGTVYRLSEDTIVKVYDSPESLFMIENERKMARLAFLKGIPTAISYDIVKVGDSYGSVFELLHAKTFNDILCERPQDVDEIVRQYAGFVRLVHEIEMDEGALVPAVETFTGYLDEIREYLTDVQYNRLKELFAAMPEDNHVIHGDFQMKNVMLVNEEPMLIDMDTLGIGHPVFDLAGLYVTYQMFKEDEPGNTEQFLGISSELADRVWAKFVEYYFDLDAGVVGKVLADYNSVEGAPAAAAGEPDVSKLSDILDRICLVGCVRFLYIIAVSDLKNSDLGKLRIRHAGEHIEALLGRVQELVF